MRIVVSKHAIDWYRFRVLHPNDPARDFSDDKIADIVTRQFNQSEPETGELLLELDPWLIHFRRFDPNKSTRYLAFFRPTRTVFVWVREGETRTIVTVFRAVCKICRKVPCKHITPRFLGPYNARLPHRYSKNERSPGAGTQ